MTQAFNPEAEGRAGQVAMRNMGPLAQRLHADACDGTDRALPLALPHTRYLAAAIERGACQR